MIKNSITSNSTVSELYPRSYIVQEPVPYRPATSPPLTRKQQFDDFIITFFIVSVVMGLIIEFILHSKSFISNS
jgi:hypothetical protein